MIWSVFGNSVYTKSCGREGFFTTYYARGNLEFVRPPHSCEVTDLTNLSFVWTPHSCEVTDRTNLSIVRPPHSCEATDRTTIWIAQTPKSYEQQIRATLPTFSVTFFYSFTPYFPLVNPTLSVILLLNFRRPILRTVTPYSLLSCSTLSTAFLYVFRMATSRFL